MYKGEVDGGEPAVDETAQAYVWEDGKIAMVLRCGELRPPAIVMSRTTIEAVQVLHIDIVLSFAHQPRVSSELPSANLPAACWFAILASCGLLADGAKRSPMIARLRAAPPSGAWRRPLCLPAMCQTADATLTAVASSQPQVISVPATTLMRPCSSAGPARPTCWHCTQAVARLATLRDVRVVLVSPKRSANIGAVCRAADNFEVLLMPFLFPVLP